MPRPRAGTIPRTPRAGTRTLPAEAEVLRAALAHLVRVYQFRDRERICCHDVSVTQCHAVGALVQRGPSTLGELAGALYLDKSTASRVVAALARKGYVARGHHPRDRRLVRLDVTAAGRRLHQRIERDLIEEERELVQDLEPGACAAAARLITRVARAAERRAGLSGGGCCAPPGPEGGA